MSAGLRPWRAGLRPWGAGLRPWGAALRAWRAGLRPCGHRCRSDRVGHQAAARVDPGADGASWRAKRLSPLREPSPAHQVLEHHDVAAVDQHQLEVAPPHRPAGPPAVLDDPVLDSRLDGGGIDQGRDSAIAGGYAYWARGGQATERAAVGRAADIGFVCRRRWWRRCWGAALRAWGAGLRPWGALRWGAGLRPWRRGACVTVTCIAALAEVAQHALLRR